MHKKKNRSIPGTLVHVMHTMPVDGYPIVLEGIEVVIYPRWARMFVRADNLSLLLSFAQFEDRVALGFFNKHTRRRVWFKGKMRSEDLAP